MEKIDFKKELKPLYQTSAKEVVQLEVPPGRFLMIDGKGDPNTAPDYAAAVEALFSISYTAKFILKKGPQALDYAVMPLEGLWWAEDMADFTKPNKDHWLWTMMILQPPFVDDATLATAIDKVRSKSAGETGKLAALDQLRLEVFSEGLAAQILHIGPFSAEGPNIERVHQFIAAHGGLRGKHHEIYLSDIRRADPSRWKTIIRQPMEASRQ